MIVHVHSDSPEVTFDQPGEFWALMRMGERAEAWQFLVESIGDVYSQASSDYERAVLDGAVGQLKAKAAAAAAPPGPIGREQVTSIERDRGSGVMTGSKSTSKYIYARET